MTDSNVTVPSPHEAILENILGQIKKLDRRELDKEIRRLQDLLSLYRKMRNTIPRHHRKRRKHEENEDDEEDEELDALLDDL